MTDIQQTILKLLLAGPMTSTELFTVLVREHNIKRRNDMHRAIFDLGPAVTAIKLRFQAPDGALVQYSITPTGRIQVRHTRCPHCGKEI